MTVVVCAEDSVCPLATASVRVPVPADQRARGRNTDELLRRRSIASGVVAPVRPETTMTWSAKTLTGGRRLKVIVLVAPGKKDYVRRV